MDPGPGPPIGSPAGWAVGSTGTN